MKKFFQNFNILGVIMLGLCVLLGVGDVAGAMFADGAAAAQPLTGETGDGTNEAGKTFNTPRALETHDVRKLVPEMIEDPVDQKLVKIRPSALPLDTILRYAGSMKTNNFEFGWYSIGYQELSAAMTNYTATVGSGDVESVYANITVDTPRIFNETDTVNIVEVDSNGEIVDGGVSYQVLVVEKLSNGSLDIAFDESDMTVSGSTYSIPAASVFSGKTFKVFALGRAAAELDVESPAITYLPKKSKGYCQIFKCQIAQSTYEKMMDKEIKFDITEVEEQALYDYRRRCEGTALFGKMQKIYNKKTGKNCYIYKTAGIASQIRNEFTLNSAATDGNAEVVTLTKNIFQGNSGAKERVALCGSGALEKVSKLNGVYKTQDAIKTEVIWGIKFSRLESNFGTLLLLHHEILDEYGWTNKMIVIDPQYIKKWALTSFERQQIDGKAIAKMNGDITIFTEAFGVAVYNPDAHAIVTVS